MSSIIASNMYGIPIWSRFDNRYTSPRQAVDHFQDLEWWFEFWFHPVENDPNVHIGYTLNFSKPVNFMFSTWIKNTDYTYYEEERIDFDTVPDEPYSKLVVDYISSDNLHDVVSGYMYGLIYMIITVEIECPVMPALTARERLLNDGPRITLFAAADNQSVEISKPLLMHISPVFNAMLTHNTVEAALNCIEILDFDFITIQTFADYCDGNPPAQISADLMVELLWFATKYDIRRLTQSMESNLKNYMTPYTVFKVAIFAEFHSRNDLLELCFSRYFDYTRDGYYFQNGRLSIPPEDRAIERFLFDRNFRKLTIH